MIDSLILFFYMDFEVFIPIKNENEMQVFVFKLFVSFMEGY